MKRFLFGALLLSASAAGACPPPGYDPAAEAELRARFDRLVLSADSIVYGVVEKGIPYDKASGVLRVIHVYRGTLRPGQKLKRVQFEFIRPPCGMSLVNTVRQPRGSYGVALLRREPNSAKTRFAGFLPPSTVDALIRAGTIRSARTAEKP